MIGKRSKYAYTEDAEVTDGDNHNQEKIIVNNV